MHIPLCYIYLKCSERYELFFYEIVVFIIELPIFLNQTLSLILFFLSGTYFAFYILRIPAMKKKVAVSIFKCFIYL